MPSKGYVFVERIDLGLSAHCEYPLGTRILRVDNNKIPPLRLSLVMHQSQRVHHRHQYIQQQIYSSRTTSSSTQSGLAGVFSGYAPQVYAAAEEFGLDSSTLWKEVASRKLVAGQESMIREIAQDLMNL